MPYTTYQHPVQNSHQNAVLYIENDQKAINSPGLEPVVMSEGYTCAQLLAPPGDQGLCPSPYSGSPEPESWKKVQVFRIIYHTKVQTLH